MVSTTYWRIFGLKVAKEAYVFTLPVWVPGPIYFSRANRSLKNF